MRRASERHSGVDWEQARARLRASDVALEEMLSASPKRTAAVFRARAEQLAKRDSRQAPMSAGLAVLVFYLNGDSYGIELRKLSEALTLDRCERAPGSDPIWCGLMNVRGELRAVMDLKRLLTPNDSGAGESGFALMLRRTNPAIGLKVDRIEGMREIRLEGLDQAPPGRYIKAVAEGLMLLDLESVLAEAFANEESSDK